MMLADKGFFEAELVERFDQLHVAFEAERRILADAMEWGHENSELHNLSSAGVTPALSDLYPAPLSPGSVRITASGLTRGPLRLRNCHLCRTSRRSCAARRRIRGRCDRSRQSGSFGRLTCP